MNNWPPVTGTLKICPPSVPVSGTSIQLPGSIQNEHAAFLTRRRGAPDSISRRIAEGAKGNVRAALADSEMWMG